MILIRRQDGKSINLDTCLGTQEVFGGLLVDMPDDKSYMIHNYSLHALHQDVGGRWGYMIVLNHEFEKWTVHKHAVALKTRAKDTGLPLEVEEA